MESDIEIARKAKPFKISRIAKKINLTDEDLEFYGKYKAKIARKKIAELCATDGQRNSRLILVTAMTPTPAGEGKSTVSIGLADALNCLKKQTVLALREPSLGPCFGIKGGATGGGKSQITPMDEINLNFTGDIQAITAANNLLSALIDNHIYNGNKLKITRVFWRRCEDMNDRALRKIITSPDKTNQQETGFDITAASEVMAILCLAQDLSDLKQRLAQIVIGENRQQKPVFAGDLKAEGAMAALLKDAILPNLIQTLEHTPALVHGGPFANIAHGTSSLIAARTGLELADYVVTEAGFGTDLGAEKFFDIFGRISGIFPAAIVLVATVRALKLHGGIKPEELTTENIPALEKGFVNLKAHIACLRQFGYKPVIALNRFASDTPAEIDRALELCQKENIAAAIAEGWLRGGRGCINLAKTVLRQIEETDKATINDKNIPVPLLYSDKMQLTEKITTVATRIYGAENVTYSQEAETELTKFSRWGYGNLPICIAKTQNSLSHNSKLLGAPRGYTFPVTAARLSAGAGFIVVFSGNINTMPGLPKKPAAENIDISADGTVCGLF